jgi:predicted patatin/cPLA2 family phospholipase
MRAPVRSPRAPAPRALVAVLLLLLSSCVARARPKEPPEPRVAARLSDTFETFAMARAGEALHVLALSGGGQDGAFGAGVLSGWRSAGRPRFDVVTGISTGALLSTHAFLGEPRDDEALRVVYTNTRKADVLCERNPLAIPFGASVDDFTALRRLIDAVIDDRTIDRVAAASEGGRRLLLVGTANLDTGALVVWDLGALARARAYRRYRDVLFASSCPPLLAEPVFIDGAMHVDGGIAAHVFVPNPEEHLSKTELAAYRELAEKRSPGKGTRLSIHVVFNGVLGTAPDCVTNSAVSIGKRTVKIVLANAAVGSLWTIHGIAIHRGHDFRLTAIPERLRKEAEDYFAFDVASMRAFYDAGLDAGRRPEAWLTEPPAIKED